MAKDKTSFILYADQRSYFDKLSDDEAGRLIKHIFSYVNDENPNPIDRITDLSFEPIKLQLKRDLKKYEVVVDRNKQNGLLGGRPKNQKEPKEPSGLIDNPTEPKKADNDNDNENDILKRKNILKKKLDEYVKEYGKQLIYDFFLYWSEHGDNDRKMRFEKERTFGIKARLNTWKNRANGKYDNPNQKFKSAWS